MIEISKCLMLTNSFSAVVARVLNAAILIWLHQHLVRRLSAEEYGLYPVVMGLTVFVPLLSTILTGGMARFVVEAYAKGDRRGVTQIVSTMFPLVLGAGMLVLVAGGLVSWHIDAIVRIAPERLWDARLLMALMMVLFAIGLPLAPFQVGLYVKQKFVWLSLLQVGTQLLRAAILISLLLGLSARIVWVPVATVAAELTRHLVLFVISRRLLPALRFRIASIRWQTARKLMSFGMWTFVAQIADALRTGINPIILMNLVGAFDVVCYNIGWVFFYQMQLATYVVTAPLQPAITAMHVQGDKARLRRTYLRGGRYALWGTMIAVTPLILYRNAFVDLYVGSEYRVAASVMAVLLLQFPLAYGNIMIYSIAHAMARVRPLALWSIVMQIGTLLLTLYLVVELRMGALGAALSALLVAAVACPLVLFPLSMRMVELSLRTLLRETIIPGLTPTLAGALVWYGLELTVPTTSWFALAMCSICGAAVYVCVLLAFCLQQNERQDVLSALHFAKERFSHARRMTRAKDATS